jgi:uncharacterized membrane protein
MEKKASRLTSVDAVRGAIMIIMALDHVRDFVHSAAGQFRPEDLARTSVPLFFTRWITCGLPAAEAGRSFHVIC